MLSSSLQYIIVRSFPECICLILSTYILLNMKINIYNVIKESIIFVIIVVFIRALPINFGIHTILISFVLGIMLYKLKNQNIIKTILTISKVCICLAISEGIYMSIATNILKVPVYLITNNTKFKSAILSLPSLVVFILFVVIFKKMEDRLNKK